MCLGGGLAKEDRRTVSYPDEKPHFSGKRFEID